jgi:tol-pal system protein YbgF
MERLIMSRSLRDQSPKTWRSALGLAALTLCAGLMVSAPSSAADDPGRVDKLEKQVKELRAIVYQARDTGHPVEVRPEGPDPAVTALTQRVDDLEATLRKLQGELEQSNHNADLSKSALEAERMDRTTQVQGLADRLARLESQVVTLTSPPPPPADPHARHAEKTTAPSEPVADTSGEFKTARTLLVSGDYGGSAQAFQTFVTSHPNDPKTAEAYYWLGESYSVRDLHGDATSAYARALKGWPKSSWAPDAVIKLSRSLAATQRASEACAAMSEFTRRYEKTATPTLKTRAAQTRDKLGCGG